MTESLIFSFEKHFISGDILEKLRKWSATSISKFLDFVHCSFRSQTMLLNTLSIITVALLAWNAAEALESWNGWSSNDNNDRYRKEPLPVTLPATKTEFKQLWYTKLNGLALATPTVYQNRVYVPTATGSFYCLQAENGNILWQKKISDVMNNDYNYGSRTSPLVYNDMIIVGLSEVNLFSHIPSHGAYVIALNRFTGALRWRKLISSHPASYITSTPQLVKHRLFVGISSNEEDFAANPTYPCCTFQGSVVALEASTGKLLWETKMIPDNNGTTTGYSGKFKTKIERFLQHVNLFLKDRSNSYF